MKTKLGRPKRAIPPKVRLQVLVEKDDADKITEHSEKTGQSVAEIARRALIAGLAEALKDDGR